jgi:iron(II)-dependent oxidoreductase
MMAHDRFFFNGTHYTVDAYLADVTSRYGGIDSVLMWPTYPNIGIDDRNQFDMFNDMPDGVVEAVARFHHHNVSVLLPLNPWDDSTRPTNASISIELANLLQRMHADGFNGDVMRTVPRVYWHDALRTVGPVSIEPEVDTSQLYDVCVTVCIAI